MPAINKVLYVQIISNIDSCVCSVMFRCWYYVYKLLNL